MLRVLILLFFLNAASIVKAQSNELYLYSEALKKITNEIHVKYFSGKETINPIRIEEDINIDSIPECMRPNFYVSKQLLRLSPHEIDVWIKKKLGDSLLRAENFSTSAIDSIDHLNFVRCHLVKKNENVDLHSDSAVHNVAVVFSKIIFSKEYAIFYGRVRFGYSKNVWIFKFEKLSKEEQKWNMSKIICE